MTQFNSYLTEEVIEDLNASRDTATTALELVRLTHEIVTFPNAGRAVFNETGQRYNPTRRRPLTSSSSTGSAATSADRRPGCSGRTNVPGCIRQA